MFVFLHGAKMYKEDRINENDIKDRINRDRAIRRYYIIVKHGILH